MVTISFVELNSNHNQKPNKDYVNIKQVATVDQGTRHKDRIIEI